jgi:protein-disulfide isomerase
MMKKIFLPAIFVALFFAGAGCSGGPQAKIASPTIGRADAPLQITEWFDFQCPACKSVGGSIMKFVVEDYVNAGKAQITYKNMAFIGKESVDAANASLCAAETGKYIEYFDALYSKQGRENSGVYTKSALAQFGADLNIEIKACIDSDKYNRQVRDELNEAANLNIKGTPTFFVNGEMINTPSSYLQMKQLLDGELRKLGK